MCQIFLRILIPLFCIITTYSKVCNVLDYGAKGDGNTDDTKSIQSAIDSCSTEPAQESTVMFPSNYNFLSFPIKIKASNTQIYISINSTVTASKLMKNGLMMIHIILILSQMMREQIIWKLTDQEQ